MQFTSEELTLVGTLSGTFLGGVFAFLIAWVSKRSEERKHYREIIMRVASEQWQHEKDIRVSMKQYAVIPPYDVYLVHILELAKIVNKRKLTPENVVSHLKQSDAVLTAALEYKRKYKGIKKTAESE